VDPAYRYGSTANGTRDPHHGVEFTNPSGTPVYAAADGIVSFAGPDEEAMYSPWSNFYGNLVVIEHEEGLFTLYAHLSKIDVETNHAVFTGMKIGEVGWTGGAIGSHLHFEVRRRAAEDYFSTQNPELWLVPAIDADGNAFGVLELSVLDRAGRLVRSAKFTIGYYPDPSLPPAAFFYGTPYSPDLLTGSESAVFSELRPGHYRVAVEINGQILERWVEVQSGKLTQVVLVAK
jgi:murein DD-endopeptidase MepM/ murein hydrolase activator NlpD